MIAIHQPLHRKNYSKYDCSTAWIEYCETNGILWKRVDCFANNIFEQLDGCDALMWYWNLNDPRAVQFAKELTFSLEKKGIIVFPDVNACWHYDDKVAQKYLLQAIDAPIVPTYIFYEKEEALAWAESTTYPKVFKTRNGAGARNVRLIKNISEAKKLIKKSFSTGIAGYSKTNAVIDRFWRVKRDKSFRSIQSLVKRILMLPLPVNFHSDYPVQKHYVYFQDFIDGMEFDYRIKITGDRCWGLKRFVRDNDFRASGSGLFEYKKENIPIELVELSFKINNSLKMQSIAFDYVIKEGSIYLLEISYDSPHDTMQWEGYWDKNLEWHGVTFKSEILIIEDLIKKVFKNKSKV